MQAIGHLKRDMSITFKVGNMSHTVHLRKGMRCALITEGGTAGQYFVDEFPLDIFPGNSIVRHDAWHYGIVIPSDNVE